MSDRRLSRRAFLAGSAAAMSAGAAGCAVADPPGTPGTPTAVESRQADGDRFVALYEAVNDSVVEIRVDIPEDPFQDGGGSGFFVGEETVVTNAHVVMDHEVVEVRFADGSWEDAPVLSRDIHSDLAIIGIDDGWEGASPLGLADGFPRIGEEVMAIGSPLGFSASASTGVVSGVNRALPAPTGFSIPAAIQTDAPINPGNSGGPLVNLEGTVVGVVFAGATETIGFAISTPLANRVIPVLQRGEAFEHSYLGVQLSDVTPRLAEANDLPETTGVYVHQAIDGEPADGILRGTADEASIDGQPVPVGGDVVVSMDESEIPELNALSTFLALETDPGDTIEIEVFRDGERTIVELELGARPEVIDSP